MTLGMGSCKCFEGLSLDVFSLDSGLQVSLYFSILFRLHFFFPFYCVWFMCACVFLCVCTCAYGGQRSTLDIFLNRSPLFSFFKSLFLFYVYVNIYLHVYVCGLHACLVPEWSKEIVIAFGTGLADSCELQCSCCELNSGTLQD